MIDNNLKPWLLKMNGISSLIKEHKIEKGK